MLSPRFAVLLGTATAVVSYLKNYNLVVVLQQRSSWFQVAPGMALAAAAGSGDVALHLKYLEDHREMLTIPPGMMQH